MSGTRRKTPTSRKTVMEDAQCATVCTMCSKTVEEASGESAGQEALFCEGACQRWFHRWCAGVSSEQFELLTKSTEFFLCSVCASQEQQKTIRELHGNVRALNTELLLLKATVAALQGMCNCSSQAAATRVTGGGPGVQDCDPSTRNGKLPWNVVAGGKKRDKGNGPANGRVDKAKQGNQGNHSGQGFSSDPLNPQPARRPMPPRIEVSGSRKVWGTLKNTTTSAVAKALTSLAKIPPMSVTVKRKYKVARNNSKQVVRWWFIIRGNEEVLQQLQANWEAVSIHTAWKLEPVLMYDHEKAQTTPSVPTQSVPPTEEAPIVPDTCAAPSNAPLTTTTGPTTDVSPTSAPGVSHISKASVQHPTMDTSQPSDNIDASPSSGCVDLSHN